MKEADRTDIDYCREIAKHFLYMDVEANHPLGRPFIYHPYARSEFIIDENGNLNSIVDDTDTLDYFRQTILKRIDNTDSYTGFMSVLCDTYCMAFLRFTKDHVSKKDLSLYLHQAWISCEFPNADANLKKSQLLKLFKKADPRYLMSEEELEMYGSFQDILTVYRGTGQKDNQHEALSWTLDKKTAEWFATRFSEHGYVYQAKIPKEHVFAFFNDRNEQEIVLDYRNLRDICRKKVRRKERKRSLELQK